MNYEESLVYLESLVDWERSPRPSYEFDLDGFRSFLTSIGSPHKKLKNPILIAGTKGKGSTAAIAASALQSAGYRVGLFTSPHIFSFTERICVDGQEIAKEDFARLVESLKPHIDRRAESGFRTVFEVLTAISFLYFLEKKVDFSILEVGLGGRLDSTNVVDPIASVITSIGRDHTDVLGKSLREIAAEKAGVIREGGTVISSPQRKEVLGVIEDTCARKGASLFLTGRDLSCELLTSDLKGSRFRVLGKSADDLSIPLLGSHQVENSATAYLMLDLLRKRFSLPSSEIREGFSAVRWPGRLQIVGQKPWIVVDGAHNPDSVKAAVRAVIELFTYRRLVLLFSCLNNKDLAGMARVLSPVADEVVVTRLDNPRSTEPQRLAQRFRKARKPVTVASSVAGGLKVARSAAKERDLILVTGSFYLVGETLEQLRSSPSSGS